MFFDFEGPILELKAYIFKSFFRRRFVEVFFSILGRILIEIRAQMGANIEEQIN